MSKYINSPNMNAMMTMIMKHINLFPTDKFGYIHYDYQDNHYEIDAHEALKYAQKYVDADNKRKADRAEARTELLIWASRIIEKMYDENPKGVFTASDISQRLIAENGGIRCRLDDYYYSLGQHAIPRIMNELGHYMPIWLSRS